MIVNDWKISATCDEHGKIRTVSANQVHETPEQAADAAKMYPKALRVMSTTLSNNGRVFGLLMFGANLTASKATGAANETGLRRIRRFVQDNRPTYVDAGFRNSATKSQFEKMLAAE